MQQVTVLGATGSIGISTLDVIQRHPERYQVYALSAHSNVQELVRLAAQCQPQVLVVSDKAHYRQCCEMANAAGVQAQILAGDEGLELIASATEVDTVMAAIVGAAGLRPTLAAAKAGKKVLLANKEALVMSGQLLLDAVNQAGAQLLPIDSEHNAIFQCLPPTFRYGDLTASGIRKLLLTGSGGPFLTTPLAQLDEVTPAQACRHPNWSMGQKISVDSATMMNKGLEFIEACWLFGVNAAQLEIVIHPQSVIHSMVQYCDGSVLAQLGNPDMRTPIAHGLAYPERLESGVDDVNFASLSDFSFSKPDFTRFPNLALAIEAQRLGQAATTALNAANEVAVAAFLAGRARFTDIARVNGQVLEQTNSAPVNSLEAIVACDAEARVLAEQRLEEVLAW